MKPISFFIIAIFLNLALAAQQVTATTIIHEKIMTSPPFAACHASTLEELPDGSILAAWFAGEREGHKAVSIWTAKRTAAGWSKPAMVADGKSDTTQYPCWNPVLFHRSSKELFLYYKVGPSPREWWGMMKKSLDNGKTWSAATRLPEGILGPIKNKPVQLADGKILHPSSVETKDQKWTIHLETSDAHSGNWKKILIDCDSFGVIQPTILRYGNKLQMLCRSKHNAVVETWSSDNGQTWGPLKKINLLNPNSGIDGVTAKKGLQVLVYNPIVAGGDWSDGRYKLFVAVSHDGHQWKDAAELENQQKGEFSYPAIIVGKDGNLHITYTWDRKNISYTIIKLNS